MGRSKEYPWDRGTVGSFCVFIDVPVQYILIILHTHLSGISRMLASCRVGNLNQSLFSDGVAQTVWGKTSTLKHEFNLLTFSFHTQQL